MKFMPGAINASDGLTKALGWILHSRHARRSMGHCNLGSEKAPEASEPGRVLEPKIAEPRPSSSDARDPSKGIF